MFKKLFIKVVCSAKDNSVEKEDLTSNYISHKETDLINKSDMSVSDFWDESHRKENFFVSDTLPEEVLTSLLVTDYIREGVRVLEIGVGKGGLVRHLSDERGLETSALDISVVALERVKKYCKKTYSSSEKLPKNYFDIIIMHLVAQHMSDDALQELICDAVRSLNDKGIFTMQFAYVDIKRAKFTQDAHSLAYQKGGAVCRSLAQMAIICEKAGALISLARRYREFPEYGTGWYCVHLVKG